MLRWTPKDFWAATPAELKAAIAGVAGPASPPMTKNELAALMLRFPDERF